MPNADAPTKKSSYANTIIAVLAGLLGACLGASAAWINTDLIVRANIERSQAEAIRTSCVKTLQFLVLAESPYTTRFPDKTRKSLQGLSLQEAKQLAASARPFFQEAQKSSVEWRVLVSDPSHVEDAMQRLSIAYEGYLKPGNIAEMLSEISNDGRLIDTSLDSMAQGLSVLAPAWAELDAACRSSAQLPPRR